MEKLYHLSHFFEFLTGLNFGGLALLEFLQKQAAVPFNQTLETRTISATNARTQVREYYDIKVTVKNGALKAMFNSIQWFLWCAAEIIVNILFSSAKTYLQIFSTNNNFVRRYFPSFFFTGLFCLLIVFLSGLEEGSGQLFQDALMNRFFILFGLSTLIFQCWGLSLFPYLVQKKDYLLLTAYNALICVALIYLSCHYSKSVTLPFQLDFFLLPSNTDKFIVAIIIISLMPTIIVFIFSGIILTVFVACTYFYNWSLHKFIAKVEVLDDIQRLNDN